MTIFVRSLALVVIIVCGYIAYNTLRDFKGEILDFLHPKAHHQTSQNKPPELNWTDDEKLILKSFGEKMKEFPSVLLSRVREIQFTKLSAVHTDLLFSHLNDLNLWQPAIPTPNPAGDLVLKIDLHKAEDAILLFYALEEVRNNNRIYEVSDQQHFSVLKKEAHNSPGNMNSSSSSGEEMPTPHPDGK